VSVAGIADFAKLVSDYKAAHVFYTANMFFFQAPSIAHPFSIPSNGYKSIKDYLDGDKRGFRDGAAYYYAKENKLNTQAEVDYFWQERFFSTEDYRRAQAAGFTQTNAQNRIQKITGVIKERDLQANIRCANAIIWFLYYQQTDLAKEFLNNTDIEKLLNPFSDNQRYPNFITRIAKGYYVVNLDISALQPGRGDAVFYYAAKFAQYADYDDYRQNYGSSRTYTVKDSESAAKGAGYASFNACWNDVQQMIGPAGRPGRGGAAQ
jgi:hypothetical protein